MQNFVSEKESRIVKKLGGNEKGYKMGTTVILGQDNPLFMKGLELKLKNLENLTLILKTDEHLFLLDFVIKHRPDIFIYDIDYSGEKNGFPLLQEIHRITDGKVRTIAFSDCSEPEIFGAFFHYGGWGYELKCCLEDEIAIAVKRVSNGIKYICSSLGGESVNFGYRNFPLPTPEQLKALTPMQRKALAIVQTGGTAKIFHTNSI